MDDSQAVMGLYDKPMWQSMSERKLALQRCDACSHVRYPPAPVCPVCLCEHATWNPVAGTGVIVSWVVFHKQYFGDFPQPYNAIAVRLDEGPIIVTRLFGTPPAGSWIDRRVVLDYDDHAGRIQHHAWLA
jgi:uncharacterized OB-fold protein